MLGIDSLQHIRCVSQSTKKPLLHVFLDDDRKACQLRRALTSERDDDSYGAVLRQ